MFKQRMEEEQAVDAGRWGKQDVGGGRRCLMIREWRRRRATCAGGWRNAGIGGGAGGLCGKVGT